MKTNKYLYVFVVQGNYGAYGWEDLTQEDTYREARARLREYRNHEVAYPHRIIQRREVNPAAVVG